MYWNIFIWSVYLLKCVEGGSTMSLNMPPNILPLREPLAEKLWAGDQATDGVTYTQTHTQTAWRTHRHHVTPFKAHPTTPTNLEANSVSLCIKLLMANQDCAFIVYSSHQSLISMVRIFGGSEHLEHTVKVHLRYSFFLLLPLKEMQSFAFWKKGGKFSLAPSKGRKICLPIPWVHLLMPRNKVTAYTSP